MRFFTFGVNYSFKPGKWKLKPDSLGFYSSLRYLVVAPYLLLVLSLPCMDYPDPPLPLQD